MNYLFGNEIEYECYPIEKQDKHLLQSFTCGNQQIDYYLHKELISNEYVDVEEGLPFKVIDLSSGEMIAFFSLSSSGIINQLDNYINIFSAIKINLFAVKSDYQKLHIDANSKYATNKAEHFYFSDNILCDVIRYCRLLSELFLGVKYLVLYADKQAYHFYKRNMFDDFLPFMQKENNMKINKNIPMYMFLEP